MIAPASRCKSMWLVRAKRQRFVRAGRNDEMSAARLLDGGDGVLERLGIHGLVIADAAVIGQIKLGVGNDRRGRYNLIGWGGFSCAGAESCAGRLRPAKGSVINPNSVSQRYRYMAVLGLRSEFTFSVNLLTSLTVRRASGSDFEALRLLSSMHRGFVLWCAVLRCRRRSCGATGPDPALWHAAPAGR